MAFVISPHWQNQAAASARGSAYQSLGKCEQPSGTPDVLPRCFPVPVYETSGAMDAPRAGMLRLEAGLRQRLGSASASAGEGNELVLVQLLIQSTSPGIRLKSGVLGRWERTQPLPQTAPSLSDTGSHLHLKPLVATHPPAPLQAGFAGKDIPAVKSGEPDRSPDVSLGLNGGA